MLLLLFPSKITKKKRTNKQTKPNYTQYQNKQTIKKKLSNQPRNIKTNKGHKKFSYSFNFYIHLMN